MSCTSSSSPSASSSSATGARRRSARFFSALRTGWHTMRNLRPTTGSTSMTSGRKARRAALLTMLYLTPAISFAVLDTGSLLQRLARPAPATTPFVEVRFSKLLDQPLVVKGQLEYHEDGALVRAVDMPFRERTEIRGETVTVERVGRSTRRFSLKRAPELRSMLGG